MQCILIGFINIILFTSDRSDEDLEIVHGDIHGLSDTRSFLKSLAGLDAVSGSIKNTEKRQMRERKAAAGLFNWEVLILIFLLPFSSFHEKYDLQNLVYQGLISPSFSRWKFTPYHTDSNTMKIYLILVQHYIVVDDDG